MPYCFVLMPFGRRADPGGGAPIDFDRIYHEVLVPAISDAGMHPHRDDLFSSGGLVHKAIFEALLLCEYAIADLTTSNANVLYELGIRHAARPASTLTISARPEAVTFDVRDLRSIPYHLDRHNRLTGKAAKAARERVTAELQRLRGSVNQHEAFSDSPLFQLVEGWRPINPDSLKTDLFADRVEYHHEMRSRLERLRLLGKGTESERDQAVDSVHELTAALPDSDLVEPGVLVDLLLTHRALADWDGMIALAESMPGYLRERTLVQEQLGLALNRRASMGSPLDRERALDILSAIAATDRASSETYGLMGRIHKDRWRAAATPEERQRNLQLSIDAYRHGFQLDPPDPFPGINACTTLYIKGSSGAKARLAGLLPVVEFSTHRLLKLQGATYWLHATLMEIAAIRDDRKSAVRHLTRALERAPERWAPPSTALNLRDLAAAEVMPEKEKGWVRDLATVLEQYIPR